MKIMRKADLDESLKSFVEKCKKAAHLVSAQPFFCEPEAGDSYILRPLMTRKIIMIMAITSRT